MKESPEFSKDKAFAVLFSSAPKLEDITPEVLEFGIEVMAHAMKERSGNHATNMTEAEFLKAGKSLLLGGETGQVGLVERIFKAQKEKTDTEIHNILNKMANEIISKKYQHNYGRTGT